MNYNTVLALVKQGEGVLAGNPPAHNPRAIEELRRIGTALLDASDHNGVVDQKISGMLEFAEIAYAPRRRRSYTRETAKYHAEADLYTIRVHIQQLRHVQKSSNKR
jgi:hypothetical protein